MEQIRDTRGELLASFQHHHIDIIITLPIIVDFDNIIVFFYTMKVKFNGKKVQRLLNFPFLPLSFF